jgi:hypothetical protein
MYILFRVDRYTNVFQCYFYHIAHPESHNGELELVAHWELRMPKIHMLAISPDGRYAAFVLFTDTPHQQNGSLYITQLDWLQAAQSERYVSQSYLIASLHDHLLTIIHSKLFSIVSSSSGSSSNPSSPLGRAIPLPCPAEDVCELKFSDMNGFYVVAKPRQSDSNDEIAVHVYAWSLQDSRRTPFPQSTIKHDVCMYSCCRHMILTHTGPRRPSQRLVHQLRSVQPVHGFCACLAREASDLPCS